MRKFLILTLFISIGFISCADQNIDKEIYNILCGVWDLYPNYEKTETKYSWGKAVKVMFGSIIIDLGNKIPYILGPVRACPIVSTRKITDKKYALTIIFPDDSKYDLIINLNENSSLWFEEMDWFKNIDFLAEFGKDHPYYKISGPENKDNPYFETIIDNLRFRATPSTDGIFLRMLQKGEKLNLLQKGKTETIEGIEGTWVQVRTEKGEVGWCFDAYLEEIK